MVIISFVKATQKHIDVMKGHLRDSDEKACWATAHYTASEGLQHSFDRSVLCWVALLDGKPIVCWGVGRRTLLSLVGVPWLLATDDICKIGFRAVRYSKKYVKHMLDAFGKLETWIDTRNKVSIAWLKWCKFNIEEAKPVGLDQKLFHRCWMEKGVS